MLTALKRTPETMAGIVADVQAREVQPGAPGNSAVRSWRRLHQRKP